MLKLAGMRRSPFKRKTALYPRRRRKCAVCRKWFSPATTTQVVCPTFDCARDYAKQAAEKRRRRELREGRERLKSRGELTAEAQAAFNAFVRLRDDGLPCISCGVTNPPEHATGGAWDCGHYLTVGAHPELRFCEDNAARQCKSCNSGVRRSKKRVHMVHDPERHTAIRDRFRAGLIERNGLAVVEWLEGPHGPKRYTLDELRDIRDTYRRKATELRKARASQQSIS